MSSKFARGCARRSRRTTAATQALFYALLCSCLGCSERSSALDAEDTPLDDADDPGNAAVTLSPEQFAAAQLGPTESFDSPDTTGGAWRVIETPGSGLVHSPVGWLSLSVQSLGDNRSPSGYRSTLYRSTDGVHWVALRLDPEHDDLSLTRIVYGAGRYLMTGVRFRENGGAVVWTSVDAEHWQERALPASEVSGPRELSYAQHRFFTLVPKQLAVSENGKDWRTMPNILLQGGAAAYGNGVYLLSGNGPMLTSEDGWKWQERDLDCSVPEACLDGPEHQGQHAPPFFAQGRFYSSVLSSADGVTWESDPARPADTSVSGHFLGYIGRSLAAWVSGGELQRLRVVGAPHYAIGAGGLQRVGLDLGKDGAHPDTVDVGFEDGLTCETAACVSVGRELLLVPPPGTPPLPDRVPRGADGAPLLNEFAECYVSGQIFCADYAARTGCVCAPEAPETPERCADVSQYRCEGQFTPRPNEPPVAGVAQAGCSCDAVDPN